MEAIDHAGYGEATKLVETLLLKMIVGPAHTLQDKISTSIAKWFRNYEKRNTK